MPEDLFEIEAASPATGSPATGSPAAGSRLASILLRVHVQTGAGRPSVAGRYGDALHIRVAAPPVGGRANEACAALLGEVLGVKSAQIELVRGEKSRDKKFRMSDVDPEAIRRALDEALAEPGPAGRAARGRGGR